MLKLIEEVTENIDTYINTYICDFYYIYIYIYIYMCVCIYIYIYIYIYMCVCVYIYIHTHIKVNTSYMLVRVYFRGASKDPLQCRVSRSGSDFCC